MIPMEIAGKANDGIKYGQRILTPMEIAGKENGGNELRPQEIDTHKIRVRVGLGEIDTHGNCRQVRVRGN